MNDIDGIERLGHSYQTDEELAKTPPYRHDGEEVLVRGGDEIKEDRRVNREVT
jgi:hypothetical protein